MKTLYLIIIMSIIISCNSNSDRDETISGFNLDNQIYLNLKNSSGQNLLDESVEGSFNIENMKLYYQVDGERVEVTVENGYNMGSLELTSNSLLIVFGNVSATKIIRETSEVKIVENVAYLELSPTIIDTIVIQSKTSKGYFLKYKVWYNNELVWELENNGVIEIIKE